MSRNNLRHGWFDVTRIYVLWWDLALVNKGKEDEFL